jgi:polyphosphate kinase
MTVTDESDASDSAESGPDSPVVLIREQAVSLELEAEECRRTANELREISKILRALAEQLLAGPGAAASADDWNVFRLVEHVELMLRAEDEEDVLHEVYISLREELGELARCWVSRVPPPWAEELLDAVLDQEVGQ